jgi:hypothetical protein
MHYNRETTHTLKSTKIADKEIVSLKLSYDEDYSKYRMELNVTPDEFDPNLPSKTTTNLLDRRNVAIDKQIQMLQEKWGAKVSKL